jgi:hypothetical protein
LEPLRIGRSPGELSPLSVGNAGQNAWKRSLLDCLCTDPAVTKFRNYLSYMYDLVDELID